MKFERVLILALMLFAAGPTRAEDDAQLIRAIQNAFERNRMGVDPKFSAQWLRSELSESGHLLLGQQKAFIAPAPMYRQGMSNFMASDFMFYKPNKLELPVLMDPYPQTWLPKTAGERALWNSYLKLSVEEPIHMWEHQVGKKVALSHTPEYLEYLKKTGAKFNDEAYAAAYMRQQGLPMNGYELNRYPERLRYIQWAEKNGTVPAVRASSLPSVLSPRMAPQIPLQQLSSGMGRLSRIMSVFHPNHLSNAFIAVEGAQIMMKQSAGLVEVLDRHGPMGDMRERVLGQQQQLMAVSSMLSGGGGWSELSKSPCKRDDAVEEGGRKWRLPTEKELARMSPKRACEMGLAGKAVWTGDGNGDAGITAHFRSDGTISCFVWHPDVCPWFSRSPRAHAIYLRR